MSDNITSEVVNATINATVEYGFVKVRENPTILLASSFLILAACGAVCITGARVKHRLREMLALKRVTPTNFTNTNETMMFPIMASVTLVGIYFALKYVSKEYVSLIISAYITVFAVSANAVMSRGVLGANVVSGLVSVAIGAAYMYSKHWALLNVLSLSLCVVAVEATPLKEFKTSAFLLIALFFYDVFWVFGTDVMLTVATSLDGPIKIMFPQNLFGDDDKKSLLGLGDIVIPGLFIVQMLRFSLYTSNGKSTAYFRTAMFSYAASLVNAMAVMLYFNHGQPALLYIVPWLLISCTGLAVVRGEVRKLFSYDEEKYHEDLNKKAKEKEPSIYAEAMEYADILKGRGLISSLKEMLLSVFGMGDGCDRWRRLNTVKAKSQ